MCSCGIYSCILICLRGDARCPGSFAILQGEPAVRDLCERRKVDKLDGCLSAAGCDTRIGNCLDRGIVAMLWSGKVPGERLPDIGRIAECLPIHLQGRQNKRGLIARPVFRTLRRASYRAAGPRARPSRRTARVCTAASLWDMLEITFVNVRITTASLASFIKARCCRCCSRLEEMCVVEWRRGQARIIKAINARMRIRLLRVINLRACLRLQTDRHTSVEMCGWRGLLVVTGKCRTRDSCT